MSGFEHEIAYVKELEAKVRGLEAVRAELDYVVNYFQGGIRPLDLNEWWRRACSALSATERKERP